MEGLRKYSPYYHGLGSSGRSSPFPGAKGTDNPRPASPNMARSLQSGKRPPSALRNYDTGLRKTINSHWTVSDIRPGSSMSNRSTNSVALASTGAANTVVSVRIKPATPELVHRAWVCDEGNTIRSSAGASGPTIGFTFDHVFKENDKNQDVYDQSVKRLVTAVIDGFHGTVFAYGMTGTGKTHSMQGTDSEPGVIPLAVRDLLRETNRTSDKDYVLKVSYLEIYNERIRDLLNDSLEETEDIKIRDDPKRGIHAYPLVEVAITKEEDFMRIMNQGETLRHSAATDFNTHSSRSHAIIQIVVESTNRGEDKTNISTISSRTSTLNMIDLAGSERAASDAERRKEGSYINKSLLTLGSVIARLTTAVQAGSTAHVPFRDSRLTRLLQNALSGLSLVSIIATINTDTRFVLETTNTLKFASRAKFIPGRAQRAEFSRGDLGLVVEKLKAEVASLRSQLKISQTVISQLQSATSQSSTTASPELSIKHGTVLRGSERDNMTENLALVARIEILENEKLESDRYIQDLQARLLGVKGDYLPSMGILEIPHTPDTVKVLIKDHYSDTSVHNVTSSPRNGTLHSLRTRDQRHEERSDNDNALADKVLAKTVLSKSQRSREEARNLTLQIAQLKHREDTKSSIDREHGAPRITPTPEREKENALYTNKVALPKHTFISPTIRAPREGFI